MIALPAGARVWLACGATDMRRGMPGLALMVQEALGRDPHAGDFFVFRGKQGSLLKILWHDGVGMSLYAKRLENGRFIWPTPKTGRWRFRRRSSPTCWTESTGGTRARPGGRRRRDRRRSGVSASRL